MCRGLIRFLTRFRNQNQNPNRAHAESVAESLLAWPRECVPRAQDVNIERSLPEGAILVPADANTAPGGSLRRPELRHREHARAAGSYKQVFTILPLNR